jgi:hypothetical protein
LVQAMSVVTTFDARRSGERQPALIATIALLTVAADLPSIVNHVGSHDFA